MCDYKTIENNLRFGGCLAHGKAHVEDHRRWSRRGFLSSLGAMGAGTFFLGATPVRVFGTSPLLEAFRRMEGDKILVLIQLKGGNDGLNTVVPFNDNTYYNLRPGISISKSDASKFKLTGDLGMHPALAPLKPLYEEGQVSIVQNVGYPEPSLSHFRSTDIWQTATDHDVIEGTGWLGRYLDVVFPNFVEAPLEQPLAVQIGAGSSLLFNGPAANMGMQLFSTEFLQRLEEGELYDQNAVPDTLYGVEMSFVRSITNNSYRYAEAVADASGAGTNSVTYPVGEGKLGTNLATVARLIKGNLGARIYHVSLQGFDTHAGQLDTHTALLDTLAVTVDAFLKDMATDDSDREVLTMTYSEFGRRAEQNGSGGTDHGEAAPLFLFGPAVNGGLIGDAPDLRGIHNGNVPHEIDFRSVYATVLEDWFGFDAAVVSDTLLGFNYKKLGFLTDSSPLDGEPGDQPGSFALGQNYPNPFSATTTIRYSLGRPGQVRMEVFDIQGKRVQTLVDQIKAEGVHEILFDADRLPSGSYFYRLETEAGVQTRRMVLVR